nr:eukaryotic translation initiation factor 2 subunit beta [Tanacetum cinerariifolium]
MSQEIVIDDQYEGEGNALNINSHFQLIKKRMFYGFIGSFQKELNRRMKERFTKIGALPARYAQMGTNGSHDGQQRLVVKGQSAPKNFEGTLRRCIKLLLLH